MFDHAVRITLTSHSYAVEWCGFHDTRKVCSLLFEFIWTVIVEREEKITRYRLDIKLLVSVDVSGLEQWRALAPLIPATAARAAMTLPLMLAVASAYGSTSSHPLTPTSYEKGVASSNKRSFRRNLHL